jgi:penicillin-binding protein 1A
LFALALLASACSVDIKPLSDPGIGASALTTIVYAADGSVLAHWHAGEDRTLVVYEDLPRHLIDAVVAIEDERFWVHPGVDAKAILRAAQANAEADAIVQGGSTITQQYLKNVLLSPARTLERKLQEASLAIRLESTMSKQDILERYLNTIYFGDGAYGVGTAAAHYFDKGVSALTLGESALLAALIQRPADTNPRSEPGAAISRRRLVLEKMTQLGWITHTEAEAADQEPINLADPAPLLARARFPYFTEALKQQLLDDHRLGETPTDRYNALFRGGLRIYTTVDPRLQAAAEDAVASVLGGEAPDGALASIEPDTGYVRAIVGGEDFYDRDDPIANFNLALQGERQPGSAFKPFVLAAALEKGVNLYDVVEGGKNVEIQTDSRLWRVENYNDATYPSLTVLDATVFSVNVVYARLIDQIGPKAVQDLAQRAGFTSEFEPFHSLALGAAEVSPFELASAYGTFAAGGVHVDPVMWTTITAHDGRVLHQNQPTPNQAVAPEVAHLVTMALTETVQRGTATQARIGRPVAGKTGTSQDHRDAWFVGYTPQLVTSVWVGFAEQNVPMEEPNTPYTVTGALWPAEIWARYTSAALASAPFDRLPTVPNEGLVTVEVDLATGNLAGPLCPQGYSVLLKLPPDAVPDRTCTSFDPDAPTTWVTGAVPNLLGSTVGDAVRLIDRAGLDSRLEWSAAPSMPNGTVVGQSLAPGEPVAPGSVLTITLAGPKPGIQVPSVLGLPREAAEEELGTYGLIIEVIELAESSEVDARRRPGMVWKQSPAAGGPVSEVVRIWANPV